MKYTLFSENLCSIQGNNGQTLINQLTMLQKYGKILFSFQISTLDYDFHKFSNPSELILSANYIEEVNAAALPSKLKVIILDFDSNLFIQLVIEVVSFIRF